MRFVFLFFVIVILASCDSENASDCIQTSGAITQQEIDVDRFNKIMVFNRVQLILTEGRRQRVILETGDNLRNEVFVRVEDSILKVSDRNVCNYTRDYGITKVYVTAPVDTLEVRNSSGLPVENIGKIKHRKMVLISEDPNQLDVFHIDGDFNLKNLDLGFLEIRANGLSTFRLEGKAFSFFIGAQDGDVRVESENFLADRVSVIHRSTNKLIVNPRLALSGIIFGLGDVISKNRPAFVNVEERFKGRLIFE